MEEEPAGGGEYLPVSGDDEPEDEEGYSSDDVECPALPKKSAIKCNAALYEALPGCIDLRSTKVETARKLVFDK